MHISDGVLPAAVWGAGLAVTAGAVAISVRRFDERRIPQIAVMTSLFFVASSIPIPVGFTSVHPLLVGLMGIVLGWLSFPALAVALFLQFVLLGTVGGITTLGVNTLILGSGALVSRCVFRALWRGRRTSLCPQAFVASVCGVLWSGAAYIAVMATAGKDLEGLARLIFIAHLPVMLLDGLVAQAAVSFLLRVKPELISSDRTAVCGAVPVGPRTCRDEARPSPARCDTPEAPSGGASLPGRKTLLSLVVAGAFLLPAPVDAHGLDIMVRTDGDLVKVEAFFMDGSPVRGATVIVRTVPPARGPGDPVEEPQVVAEGTTDREGFFNFRPLLKADMEVVVEDVGGHRKSRVIPTDKLAVLFPGESSPAGDAAPAVRSEGGADAGATGAEDEGPDGGQVLAASEGEGLTGLGPVWVRIGLGLLAITGLALLARRLARMGRTRHAP